MDFYIGQTFTPPYPPEVATWCNQNNAHIEVREDGLREIVANPAPPAPTHEEVREMRAIAYQAEADPITAHISRLRDEEQTEEIVAEIAELMAERTAKVAEIKEQYPYPEELEAE